MGRHILLSISKVRFAGLFDDPIGLVYEPEKTR